MQPVNMISEVQDTFGAWGYSALVLPLFGGEPVRKTLYYVRDADGFCKTCLILNAAEAL